MRSCSVHLTALFLIFETRGRRVITVARDSLTISISEGGLRMSQRLFTSTAAAMTAFVMLCAQTHASGQTAPAATKAVKPTANTSKAWTLPRTPDGHPDLQGVWTNSTE